MGIPLNMRQGIGLFSGSQISSTRVGWCATSFTCCASYRNALGLHSNVWTGQWDRKSAERAIKGTKDLGYRLIEINVCEPDHVDGRMTKSLLEENGLTASGSLGLRLDADISSTDEHCARNGKDLLLNGLRKAHEFGGKILCGVTHSAMAKYPSPPTKENWANSVRTLREVGQEAQDLGMQLGLEVVNRYESNLVNTATQAMEMISDIGLPNICVHLDTYHMNIEEDSMESAVRNCADRLGYIHVGESHRGYLGTGLVDLDGLFTQLAQVGFEGPIVFESFSSEIVGASMANSLSVWRNMWTDSKHLAAHAFTMMDGMLNAAAIKANRENRSTN